MLGLTRGNTYIVDFATLADGRVAALLASGLVTGRVLVPDIELFADANESLIERAATTVARLKEQKGLKVQVTKSRLEGDELIKLAHRLRARVVTAGKELKSGTGDRVAITVIDEIYETMKPVYLPGAVIVVKLVKKGKEANEGIGYLDGGIKVVVEAVRIMWARRRR